MFWSSSRRGATKKARRRKDSSTRQQDEALGHNSSMDFFTNGITTRRRNESAGKRAQMGSKSSVETDKQNHNHDGRAEDTEQQPSSDLNNSVFSPEPQTRQERARSTFSHSMEKSKRRRRRLNSSMTTAASIVDLPQQIAYHGANYHSKNKGETDHHGIKTKASTRNIVETCDWAATKK